MLTNKVSIRHAIGKDAKNISLCNKLSLPVSYSPREYITYILNKIHIVLVAEINDKIIGYSLIRKEPHCGKHKAHIMSIAVLEEYRSRGIGKQLLNKSEKEAVKQFNVNIMTLYAKIKKERAINFYKREGFKHYAKMPNYYGKKSHGSMMMKTLKYIALENILTNNLSDYLKTNK